MEQIQHIKKCTYNGAVICLPPTDYLHLLSPHSLLSIPSVVVTISILASPQQSGGTHQLVARSVSSLPDVPADCAEQRPCRRRRTKSDCLLNKNIVLKEILGVGTSFVNRGNSQQSFTSVYFFLSLNNDPVSKWVNLLLIVTVEVLVFTKKKKAFPKLWNQENCKLNLKLDSMTEMRDKKNLFPSFPLTLNSDCYILFCRNTKHCSRLVQNTQSFMLRNVTWCKSRRSKNDKPTRLSLQKLIRFAVYIINIGKTLKTELI